LVGHGEKVSIVLARDYKPFEAQSEEDFYEESKSTQPLKKEVVTDRTFEKLKEREEELNNELARARKARRYRRRNQFEADESFSFYENGEEEVKRKQVVFQNEGDLSGISYFKTEESDEELINDEMFSRALKETIKFELESKSGKSGKRSRLRVWRIITF
jgi:hypothetical protein